MQKSPGKGEVPTFHWLTGRNFEAVLTQSIENPIFPCMVHVYSLRLAVELQQTGQMRFWSMNFLSPSFHWTNFVSTATTPASNIWWLLARYKQGAVKRLEREAVSAQPFGSALA
jgi:hypothetical protein